MEMLFNFDHNGFLKDQRAYQIAEFRSLLNSANHGERCFRFVALMTDYESPLWQLPVKSKRITASKECFSDPDYGESISDDDLVKSAMIIYNDIQYDHIEEQLAVEINTHAECVTFIRDTRVMGADKDKIAALGKARQWMNDSEKEIDRLKKKRIDRRTQETRSRGDKVDSFLSAYLTDRKTG